MSVIKRNNLLIMFCVVFILTISCLTASAMTEQQKTDCHVIIHLYATNAAAWSAVLAQAPTADNVALALIIGNMTMAWIVEDIGWEVADALDTGNWRELLLP